MNEQWLKALPKAEPHLHLEGALEQAASWRKTVWIRGWPSKPIVQGLSPHRQWPPSNETE